MSPDVTKSTDGDASDEVSSRHRTDGRSHDDTLIPPSETPEPSAPPSKLRPWAESRTCCCPHPDRHRCAEWRSRPGRYDSIPFNPDLDDPCECPCHAPESLGDSADDA